jgi:poly-gamma-glutamate system protein
MFRPQIQKTRVLVAMAFLGLSMVHWASNSTVIHTAVGYEEKLLASDIMKSALKILKKEVRKREIITIFRDIDPNTTGLIFKEDSPIRTSSGDLKAKQTVLKPNFAAIAVDLFYQAGLVSGDTIAVGMTGSMPGANIAVYSACKAMGIHPIPIASVGASMWGATDPKFTWLDMESTLNKHEVFEYKSVAASLGGRGDCLRKIGKNGGKEGRKLIIKATKRNKIPLIDYTIPIENKNVSKSIVERMDIFNQHASNYKAYVNVGGGVSSIGVGGKDKISKSGFITSESLLNMKPRNSMVRNFANNGIPIINISHIPQLVRGIIPYGSDKIPTGEGSLYKETRYNLMVAGMALVLLLVMVIGVGVYSHQQIIKRMQSYEPESIL